MRTAAMNNFLRKVISPIISALLIILLLTPLHAKKIPCVWTGIEKIVAVGDIHGDYASFLKILRAQNLIDGDLRWTGGKTHFVQTGDIIDRGPDAKKAFDLLMRLEKEAEEAGGKVHVLLGNHEEMNITGISFDYPGYVTAEQFVSFLPDDYRENKEKEFRKQLGEKALDPMNLNLSSNNFLRKKWEDLIKTDIRARKEYIIHFNDVYGKWLLKLNAVIKINDTIFVHGGISKKYSTRKLEDINDHLRRELSYLRRAAMSSSPPRIPFTPQIVYKSDGPLWHRGLALMDEGSLEREVDEILSNLGASHMVIAHTTQAGNTSIQMGSPYVGENYLSRFQGKIWIIDTGISEHHGGFLSALIIENGKFSLWGIAHE